MDSIKERLLQLLQRTLGAGEVSESAALGKTPRWDSLRHIRVVLALEKEFALKIGPDKLTQLTSVANIYSFLVQQDHV